MFTVGALLLMVFLILVREDASSLGVCGSVVAVEVLRDLNIATVADVV